MYLANKVTCDDGDTCTGTDTCGGGQCAGGDSTCQCTSDADCETFEDGDLCNGTLVCDKSAVPFTCNVAKSTVVTCPILTDTSGAWNFAWPPGTGSPYPRDVVIDKKGIVRSIKTSLSTEQIVQEVQALLKE